MRTIKPTSEQASERAQCAGQGPENLGEGPAENPEISRSQGVSLVSTKTGLQREVMPRIATPSSAPPPASLVLQRHGGVQSSDPGCHPLPPLKKKDSQGRKLSTLQPPLRRPNHVTAFAKERKEIYLLLLRLKPESHV